MFLRFNCLNVSRDESEKILHKVDEIDLDNLVRKYAFNANILKVNELVAKGASPNWALEGYWLGGHILKITNLVEVTENLELRELIVKEENNLSQSTPERALTEYTKNLISHFSNSYFNFFFEAIRNKKPVWEVEEEEEKSKIELKIRH